MHILVWILAGSRVDTNKRPFFSCSEDKFFTDGEAIVQAYIIYIYSLLKYVAI